MNRRHTDYDVDILPELALISLAFLTLYDTEYETSVIAAKKPLYHKHTAPHFSSKILAALRFVPANMRIILSEG